MLDSEPSQGARPALISASIAGHGAHEKTYPCNPKGEGTMLTRKIRAGLMSGVMALGVALAGQAMADLTAKEAADLDAQAKATLTKFKAETKGSQAVLDNAKGILVCPKITKGGFLIGVESGNCVLDQGYLDAALLRDKRGQGGARCGDTVLLYDSGAEHP